MVYDVTLLAVLWMLSALLKARTALSGIHVWKQFFQTFETHNIMLMTRHCLQLHEHTSSSCMTVTIRCCCLQVHKPASADNNRADIIFLRDYDHGVMSNETVLRMAGKDNHRKAIKKDKSRKLQEKKTDQSLPKPGEHIFKGHRSYDLMRELQLGIMFSIANASKSRMSLTAKDVTQEAFGLEVSSPICIYLYAYMQIHSRCIYAVCYVHC